MSTGRPDWVPYYPAKLLGALAGLPPDQKLIYQIVLLRIYEVWGPCPDSLDTLARRCGINRRRTANALDDLFKANKLERAGAGIMNPFAREIMADVQARRQRREAAAVTGASARHEKRQQKQTTPPSNRNPTANESHAQLQLQEDSLFSDENRPPAAPLDERTKLFRQGLATLVEITGRSQSKCRALIGGWLRTAQDDAVLVHRAIEDAKRERVADPVPWIIRAIERRPTQGRTADGRGSASTAARELVKGIREGALAITPRPAAPSLLRGESGTAAGFLPPK